MHIFHLSTRLVWKKAPEAGEYTAESLEEEGFIHCSTAEQLLSVANMFYRDVEDPVVLWLDPELLQAEVRWESPDPDDPFSENRFPHVYGPVNLDAVVRVTPLQRDAAGSYSSF